LITVLYIIFGRKFIKSKLLISTHKINIDALIDKYGVVTKDIGIDDAGQVKVENEIWRARSDRNIKKNTKIRVISVEG